MESTAIRFIIVFAFLLSGRQMLYSQQDWRSLLISEKEGLPVNQLFDLTATDDGILWLASLYGLIKFDGETFELLSHDPLDTASITFGRLLMVRKSHQKSETLWLGSDSGGLCCFDVGTNKANTFLYDAHEKGSIGGNFIAGFFEDKNGGIWIGTDNFTLNYQFPGSNSFQKWQPPLPMGIHSVKEAGLLGAITVDVFDENRLWIGSRFGVYSFDIRTGAFKLHPFEQPFAYFYTPTSFPVWQDETGLLWTMYPGRGLLRYDPNSHLWDSWKTNSAGLHKNWINQIFPLHDSLLLCLTKNDGLLLFNRQTSELRNLNTTGNKSGGISSNEQMSAFKIENGDIWLATISGLIRITWQPQPVKLKFFPTEFPALQKNNWQRAYTLSPDGRHLYMGTLKGDGLLIFDWKNQQMDFVRYKSTADPSGWDVWLDDLCFDHHGNLWIGSDAGLLRFDAPQQHIYPVFPVGKDSWKLQRRHIASMAAGIDGRLWIGTLDAGLFCLDLASHQLLPFPSQGGATVSLLEDERIKKIYLDQQGVLWIGTENLLYRYQLDEQRFLPPLQSTVTPKNISDIDQDTAGNIWISTYGTGLFRFDRHYKSLAFINNPVPSGANWMYELIIEPGGTLWIGTEAGLAQYKPDTQEFINFGEKDGVEKITKGALIQLPDGTIINGTSRGFHYFQPDAWSKSNTLPKPYLKQLSFFDEKIPLRTGAVVALRHDQNSFSIEFSAINTNLYPKTTFRYRLEGQESKWTEAGDRRFVTYTNLPPGKYVFHLKSADKRGEWSEPVQLLTLNITPAFYQTLWFKIMAGLSGLVMLWGIYQLRIRRIRRQEQWKRELYLQKADVEMQVLRAQMNPHFLHNSLNAINWFIQEKKPRLASKYLVKFSRLMRLVLNNSQLKKITLAQEVGALKLYVDMEQIRLDPSFSFVLELAEDLDPEEIEIPPLLLQPYVENAIWHGLMPQKRETGRLVVHLWLEGEYLFCTVDDNGIGREASAKIKEATLAPTQSYGMEITSQRLALLERIEGSTAHVQIFDLKNEQGEAVGTRVQLKIAVG